MMKMASFTLPDQTVVFLEKLVEKTGLKKSDLVRRAIEDFYKKKIRDEKAES